MKSGQINVGHRSFLLILHEHGAVAAACLLQRLPAYPTGKAALQCHREAPDGG